MATMSQITEGLNILSKYVDAEHEYVQGQHDMLCIPGKPDLLKEDLQRLKELGFRWAGDEGGWQVFT